MLTKHELLWNYRRQLGLVLSILAIALTGCAAQNQQPMQPASDQTDTTSPNSIYNGSPKQLMNLKITSLSRRWLLADF
jgi:hypothetical protein